MVLFFNRRSLTRSVNFSFSQRASLPYLVLFITLLLTAIASISVDAIAREKDRVRFENSVQRMLNRIEGQVQLSIALLQSGRGLFAANQQVSQAEFRAYVSQLQLREQYPGTQGIGYSMQVKSAEKEALVAEMKKQGVASFSIRPAYNRSEYHAIVYLEPMDLRNRAAIGYDMFTEPTRRAAMVRARDTGLPAMTGQVTLVQEIERDKQAGFLIYAPIYRAGSTPKTVAERQAMLQGFIYSPFRADDFIQGVLKHQPEFIDFEIYDGTQIDVSRLLYQSSTRLLSSHPRFRNTKTIAVLGQPWTIHFVSRSGLEQGSEAQWVPLIILAGGAIGLVLFGLTRLQVQARFAAERAAAELRRSEAALRQSEQQFQAFMDHSPAAAWITDRQGYIRYVSQTYHHLFNLPDQVVGKNVHEVYVPEFADLFLENIRKVADHYQVVETVEPAPRPDGTVGDFLVYKFPIPSNSKMTLVGGVAIDITERKLAEEALIAANKKITTILESTTDAFVAFDQEWQYTYVNDAAEQLLNRSRDELLGKQVWQVFPQTPDQLFYRELHRSFAEQVVVEFEEYSLLLDRWLEVRAYPFHEGVAVYFRDTTERKQAEEALRQSEERLRLALDAGQMGTWDWNLQTNVEVWDNVQHELFGVDVTEKDLSFDTFLSLIHPDDLSMVEQSVEQAIEQGTYKAEFRIIRPDRTVRWIAARGSLVQGQPPTRMIGVNFDITERKQAEAERDQLLSAEQQARKEAETANRLKDEFLAVLSHELRSPLNAILGWLTLLRTRNLDEATTARALETVERNARSQSQLIEDLLDVSRIIRGQLQLNVHAVTPSTVIEAAIETVRLAADAKEISLQVFLDPDAGSISGDAARLQQVVWNLLTNAIKFTPRGGQVQVRLARVDSSVEITVADTGKGISPEFLPYVFDRFRQADSSITRTHGGLGLGLSIVRHLIELHGGTVQAESAGFDQGATFTIRLPCLAVMPVNELEARIQPEVNGQVLETGGIELAGLRVLVVDDEADARDLIAHILKTYGADVMTVSNAEAAITTLIAQTRITPVDVLVSDIGMPQEDGYTLMRRIRQLDAAQGGQIPAIALTAYARPEDYNAAFLAGFQVHLAKPVEAAELVAAIATLTGRAGISCS